MEVEVETLRGSLNGSIAGDTTADGDLEELERERARERTARWAAAHPGGGGLDCGAPGDGPEARAPGGGPQGGGGVPGGGAQGVGGAPGWGARGGAPGTTASRRWSGTFVPVAGGQLSPSPTTSSGPR